MFTVAIHTDGQPLPAGLATAACRLPTLAELPAALAAAGCDALGAQVGNGGRDGEEAGAWGEPSNLQDAQAEAAEATAAAAAVDAGVRSLVDGLPP